MGHGTNSASGGMHGGGSDISENGPVTMFDIFKLFSGLTTMDPNGFVFMRRVTTPNCKDCTVLRGRVIASYENGTRASVGHGVYIHHAFLVDVTKKAFEDVSNCKDILASMTPFLGADMGEHYQYFTSPDGMFPSGYYLKDSTMVLQAELINYKTTPQTVYLDVEAEYLPGKVGQDARQHVLAATSESDGEKSQILD
jgi:hypothetical protein